MLGGPACPHVLGGVELSVLPLSSQRMASAHACQGPANILFFRQLLRQSGQESRRKGIWSVHSTLEHAGSSNRSAALQHDGKAQKSTREKTEPLRAPQKAERAAPSRGRSSVDEQHRALKTLAELFPPQHVQDWSLGLLLYLPFGCALAAMRMALWVVLLLSDSGWVTNNDTSIDVLLFILGIEVRWHNEELIPAERHVLVSNHVTTGDLMMLYKRPQRYVHLVAPGLPQRVTEVQNHRIRMKVACKDNFMELSEASQTDPIHLFPEGGMTNGRGMMKFSRGFMTFAQRLPVVPMALRAELPWGLATHTLTSSFAANMFWFCFAPRVRLDATVLPPMQLCEGEHRSKFVERVQATIAEELAIPIKDITIQRKREVVKLARKLEKL